VSAELNQKLDDVLTESKKVREITVIAERARRRLLEVVILVGALAVLLLGGVLWTVLQIQNVADTIACYTTVGTECYERQQQRSAAVVQGIIDAQIAAVECQDEPNVRACVEQKLAP
jgi:hypothetical protein